MAPRKAKSVTLRLGYFPNVTHATALVGVQGGVFAEKLGKHVKLETKTFNAGPEAVTALLAGAIDATYIGPNPSVNAFQQSHGAVRVVAGAASGGAYLVVKPNIDSAADLKGKKVASPQLGNTQDIALRSWLKQHGLKTDANGGGDVSVIPQDNATTLDTFRQGAIAGAWVPEPWATRLVDEGGGKILVDERSLWPHGQYVTTDLLVSTSFLKPHPDVVKRLLEGQVAANQLIHDDRARCEKLVGEGIEKVTGKPLAPNLISASFDNIEFTNDPIVSSLKKSAKQAHSLGLLDSVKLEKLFDLELLNEVLKANNLPTVSST